MSIKSLLKREVGFSGKWGSTSVALVENWDKWNAEHKGDKSGSSATKTKSSGEFDVSGMPKQTKGDVKGLVAKSGQKVHVNGSTAGEFAKLASEHGHTVHHENGKLIAKSSTGEHKGEFHPHGMDGSNSSSDHKTLASSASAMAHKASQQANGGMDHELSGTLAYQGKDTEQHFASHPKMEHSNYAMQSAKSGQHGFAAHFHQSSAEMHDQQAKEATGNAKGLHEKAASLHREAAAAHALARKNG